MSEEISPESNVKSILRYLILMETILGVIIVLILVLWGCIILLNIQPMANDIENQIQRILRNPLYEISSFLGVSSLIIGGLMCFFGSLSATQSPVQGISPVAYARLKPGEINRLQRARLSWITQNFSLLILGICFIIQAFILIIVSMYI
ncbi:MAG: hypothetical protein ACFE95_22510 [Candidatus Hodarchaeota archaeon]